jgi:hypothetical protein
MSTCPAAVIFWPGGGISLDGQRWVSSRPAFLLPVQVLSALFRRLFLTQLVALHAAGKLGFHGRTAPLADVHAFRRHLAPVRKARWVARACPRTGQRPDPWAKPPFAGPEAVLAYLSRYTHRVAIANSRLLAFDSSSVTFRTKDYRHSGPDRQQVMILAADAFIQRFLLHVLPRGFHRIRHYGLLASATAKASIARARELLGVASPPPDEEGEDLDVSEDTSHVPPCPCCGGRMRILETFERWQQPRGPPHAHQPAGTIAA